MKRRLHSPGSRRRGVMLIYFVVLIPIAIMLMLLSLTRVEIGLRDTQREQNRLQARMAAQSALNLWTGAAGAATRARQHEPLGGGASCELSLLKGDDGKSGLLALGIVQDRGFEYRCEIRAAIPPGGGNPIPFDTHASVEPLPGR